MRYILLALAPLLFYGCQAAKLVEALGFHLEVDIDRPSDSLSSEASGSPKEIMEVNLPPSVLK